MNFLSIYFSRYLAYLSVFSLLFMWSVICLASPEGNGEFSGNSQAEKGSDRKYSPDLVLVRFKESVVEKGKKRSIGDGKGKAFEDLPISTQAINKIKNKGKVSVNRIIKRKNLKEKSKLARWHEVKLPKGVSVEEALVEFKNDPDIEYVEPDYVITADAIPNDTHFDKLWGMQKIDAPTAWDSETGSSNVVVAVIDSGVNYLHPDLAANMWTNPDEIPNGLDDDGNGYVDDIYGVDFAQGCIVIPMFGVIFGCTTDGDPMDVHGHGTHVSGTIGAVGNNAEGVVGVNWNTRIMAVRFLGDQGYGLNSGAVKSLDYAVSKGADITNNSWGSSRYSQAIADAIEAAGEAGLLNVVAAGNSKKDLTNGGGYPGGLQLENMISVAATDHNDDLASFSNYGPHHVHLAAPGVGIASTVYNGYYYGSGTSMAAPHVAGAAALVMSKYPELSVDLVTAQILDNVDPIPSLVSKTMTAGRLNLAAALQPPLGDNNYRMVTYPRIGNVASGDQVTAQLNVLGGLNYSGLVTLSVSSPNALINATLSENSVQLSAGNSADVILTVVTQAALPQGTYPIDIMAVDEMLNEYTTRYIIAVDGPKLDIVSYTATPLITSGDSAEFTLDITSVDGYVGDVVLEVEAVLPIGPGITSQVAELPEGMVIVLDKTTLSFVGNDTHTVVASVTTTLDTPAGFDYNITVSSTGPYSSWHEDMMLGVWLDGIDLVAGEVSVEGVSALNFDAGVPFNFVERNQGVMNAHSHDSAIYLSTDEVIEPTDILLDTVPVPLIEGGGKEYETIRTPLFPDGLGTGNYYIGSIVDHQNQVVESGETNNVSNVIGIELVNDVDYTVTDFSSSDLGIIRPDIPINLSATVKNIGSTAGWKDTELGVYLSDDALIDQTDLLVAGSMLEFISSGAGYPQVPLLPGEEKTKSLMATLGMRNVTQGRYYLGAVIDSNNAQVEADESNNVMTLPLDVIYNVDFEPTNITTDSAVINSPLQSFVASAFIKNYGETSLSGIAVSFYLSIDTTLDASDIPIGSVSADIPSLGGKTVSITSNSGFPLASYYVIVEVDPENNAWETDETNNVAYGQILEVTDVTDAAVTNVSVSGTHYLVNDALPVSYRIENTGETQIFGGASGKGCDIYLSIDGIINPVDDIKIADCPEYGLSMPGESQSYSVNALLPPTLVAGDYYLGVHAYSVSDPNTANDISMGPVVTIGANLDLSLSNLSMDSTHVMVGSPVEISVTLSNSGVDNVPNTSVRVYASVDGSYSVDDALVTEFSSLALTPSSSVLLTKAVETLPGLSTGDYYLIAVVDESQTYPETNENNNTVQSTLFSALSDIDLSVVSVVSDQSPVPREGPVSVAVTVSNSGTMDAPVGYEVKVYATTNVTRDPPTYLGKGVVTKALSHGETETVNVAVTIPHYNPSKGQSIYFNAHVDEENQVAELDESNNSAVIGVSMIHAADLIVSNIQASRDVAMLGDEIDITSTIKNTGVTTVISSPYYYADYWVVVFLSTDKVVDPNSDVVVDGWNPYPNHLGQNESTSRSVKYHVDGTLPSGAYYVGVTVDNNNERGETDESNNTSFSEFPIVIANEPAVDLLASFATVNTRTLAAGSNVAVSSGVYNRGSANAAAGHMVDLYLSHDKQVTPADIYLGSWQTTLNLADGAQEIRDLLVSIPANTAAGTYYVGAIADATGVVTEISESNNSIVGTAVNVTASSHTDLSLSYLNVSTTTVAANGAMQFTSTVKNTGDLTADAGFSVGIYLSQDPIINHSDIPLGVWQTTLPLTSGSSQTHEMSVILPDSVTAGSYYYGVIVDAQEQVNELNESNNITVNGTLTVVDDFDLTVTTLNSSSGNVFTGDNITLTATVRNDGVSTIDSNYSLGFYLSDDAVIESSDRLLGSWIATAPISGGSESIVTLDVKIPFSMMSGSYTLGALVDVDGVVSESNEANNKIAAQAIVISQQQDVVVSSVTTGVSRITVGDAITIQSTVTNGGASELPAGHTTTVYLSSDNIIDATDTAIGSWTSIYDLANGVSESGTVNGTIPLEMTPGNYYIGAIADSAAMVTENNEENNALAGAQITVTQDVDLTMLALNGNASAVVGESLTVNGTVHNSGTAVVEAGYRVGFYLSVDAVIDSGDIYLGDWSGLTSLMAGESTQISKAMNVPLGLEPMTYYLGAIADYNASVFETNEANNSLLGAGVVVTEPVAPPLFIDTTYHTSNVWVSNGGFDESATAVAYDPTGNLYLTGYFNNSVDFDPTSGVDTHSTSLDCLYVRKTNVDGSYGWTRSYVCDSSAGATAIAIDSVGDVYISGSFTGTLDFDPLGLGDVRTATDNEAFLLKLSADGVFQWVKTTGDTGYSVEVDSQDNIYFAYEQGSGSSWYSYLVKYSSDGIELYTHAYENISIYDMAIDEYDNLFMTGSALGGDRDFDPSANVDLQGGGAARNPFFSRQNADGSHGWAKVLPASDWSKSYTIDVGKTGIYIGGVFRAGIQMDPGPNTAYHAEVQYDDSFIGAYELDGTYRWSNIHVGSGMNDTVRKIRTGLGDDIFLLGIKGGDMMFAKYHAETGFVWSKTLGDGVNANFGLDFDSLGNMAIAGTAFSSSSSSRDIDPMDTTYSASIYKRNAFEIQFKVDQDSDGELDENDAYPNDPLRTTPNNIPQSSDSVITINEDTSYTLLVSDTYFSDADVGENLVSMRIELLPSDGDLLLSGVPVTVSQEISTLDLNSGNLTYTPAANEFGAPYASLQFSVTDGEDWSITPSTITFNVTAQNDAPTTVGSTITLDEDTSYSFTEFDISFSDVDVSDSLVSIRIDSLPMSGSLQYNGTAAAINDVISDNGLLTFTPSPHDHGTNYTSFNYSVSDGTAWSENSAPMWINVTSINDQPSALMMSLATYTDIPINGVLPASDGDGDVLTYRIVSNGSAGSIVINNTQTGEFTYTPNSGVTGPDSFTYAVNDGTVDSNVATAFITINAAIAGDGDGDGMADDWEVLYGLDTLSAADAIADSDGDGITNLREYQNGSDPTAHSNVVTWTDKVYVSVSGETLTATYGGNYGWHSGAATVESVVGDGAIELTVSGSVTALLGLSTTNIDHGRSVEYAIYHFGLDVRIIVNSVDIGKVSTAAVGDVLRVERVGDTIYYKKNGVVIYTTTGVPTVPMIGDASIHSRDKSITKVRLYNDTDGDGMHDSWETAYGFDPMLMSDGIADPDSDGVLNLQEYQYGTNPHNADTDNDGMPDGWEIRYGFNPLDATDAPADNDSDGISNVNEYIQSTSPILTGSEPIVWTALSGVTAADNTLTKTNSQGWTAGAVSSQQASADIVVEYTTVATDTYRMLGLSSSNIDANYNTIDYAIYSDNSGNIHVYEKGNHQGGFGAYQTGDVLSVERQGETITYKKNGVLLYTSTVPSSGKLMADSSIYTTGAQIVNAKIRMARDIDQDGMNDDWEVANGLNPTYPGDALHDEDSDGLNNLGEFQKGSGVYVVDSDDDLIPDGWEAQYGLDPINSHDAWKDRDGDGIDNLREYQNGSDPTAHSNVVTWTDKVYVSVSGETLKATYGGNYGWKSGAATVESVVGDGAIELTVGGSVTAVLGLSTTNIDHGRSVEYAIYHFGLDVRIIVNNVDIGKVSTAAVGDVLRVERVGDTIYYKKNGVVIYTTTGVPTVPMIGDASIHSRDKSITKVRLYNDTDGDGMHDSWEVAYGFDPAVMSDGTADPDLDGVLNLQEYQYGTNPHSADTDGDGIPDGWEIRYGLNPLDVTDASADNDGDGTSNVNEFVQGTVPILTGSEPIVWTELSGVMATDNTLIKTNSQGWTAGAISSQKASADIAVEYTTLAIDTYRMFGLSSSNINANYDTIDYAIYSDNSGNIHVYEKGNHQGGFGSYQTGDVLGVERQGETITYKQNGVILYTSTTPSSGNLIADSSIHTPGAQIVNAMIQMARDVDQDGMNDDWELVNGLNPIYPDDALHDEDSDGLNNLTEFQKGTGLTIADSDGDLMPDGWEVQNGFDPTDASDASLDNDGDGFSNLTEYQSGTDPLVHLNAVTWIDLVGAVVSGDSLKASYGGNPGWKAGAATSQVISGDGGISVTANTTSGLRVFGLSTANTDHTFTIEYGIYMFGHDIRIVDNYVDIGKIGIYQLNDQLSIERVGNTLYYKNNGVTIYTVNNAPAGTLIGDASIHSSYGSIYQARIYNDGDSDGMDDLWEGMHGFNPADASDGLMDADLDGLNNAQEYQHGTQPHIFDTDGDGSSDGWEVTNNLDPLDISDARPIANAGADQPLVVEETLVNLSGSGNFVGGTIDGYAWDQVGGISVSLANTNTATTTFVAPTVLAPEVLTFELTVINNEATTATDQVVITVNPVNTEPTANAGADQPLADERTFIALEGGGVDTDGVIATYSWSQVGGTDVVLAGVNSARATFVTPETKVVETLVFELVVGDNEGASSAADQVVVTVNPVNALPSADAGVNQLSVGEGVLVNLQGSGSDSDGTIMSYSWTQSSGTSVTLTGDNTATPSFTTIAPTLVDPLIFELTVVDDEGGSASDQVVIRVNSVNIPPTADAGPSHSMVDENSSLELFGSGDDIDGTIASYAWEQVSGRPAPMFNADTATLTIITPNSNIIEQYVFELTVTDNEGASASDLVMVTVNPETTHNTCTVNGVEVDCETGEPIAQPGPSRDELCPERKNDMIYGYRCDHKIANVRFHAVQIQHYGGGEGFAGNAQLTKAYRMNDNTDIVGEATTLNGETHAVRTNVGDGYYSNMYFTDLGDEGYSSSAREINNRNTYVGSAQTPSSGVEQTEGIWQATLGNKFYAIAANGNTKGVSTGIASDRYRNEFVTGYSVWSNVGGDGLEHGYIWTLEGETQTSQTIGSYGQANRSIAINDSKTVVGFVYDVDGTQAYQWSDGTLTTLTDFGGTESQALDINNNVSPVIVGYANNIAGDKIPFSWKEGVMTALPNLAGSQSGEAKAITDAGDIVGTSGGKATFWRDGIVYDLNAVLDNSIGGITLIEAVDINSRGRVLVKGDNGYYILIPSEQY